ncbi:MAG: hypothetical protein IPH75_11210 [bacterium]|nr:hypothetical protein [bacterium]
MRYQASTDAAAASHRPHLNESPSKPLSRGIACCNLSCPDARLLPFAHQHDASSSAIMIASARTNVADPPERPIALLADLPPRVLRYA